MFEQVLTNLANVVKVGYKSNAFAPLVWFDAVVIPLLLCGIYCLDAPLVQYMLVALICLIILFTAAMYLVLFLKDPKLLQSESFRIEDKKLDMIAQKGAGIIIEPVHLTPPPTQIGEGGQHG